MDYEKKYNEALERARKIHDEILNNELLGFPEQIREIFPELRESEDERIRKLLVWQVHRNIEDDTNDLAQSVYDGIKGHDPDLEESIEDWKRCLAYLEKQKDLDKMIVVSPDVWDNAITDAYENGKKDGEKQKEQNGEDEEYTDFTIYRPLKNEKGKYECIPYSFYGSLTSFSEDKDLIDFLRTCFYTKEECEEWIEKQKEQKPHYFHHEVDETGWSEEYRKAYYDGWNNCNMQHEQAKAEQKPAEWSEEDELMRTAVIQTLKMFGGQGTTEMQIDWLKSLRPQPQQNMSISFMLYLDEIRPEGKMCLSNGECNDIEDAFKKQDWPRLFKYINKYQPHWKPSKEQMKHLERCFSHGHTSQLPNQHVLESLYNELKKLT